MKQTVLLVVSLKIVVSSNQMVFAIPVLLGLYQRLVSTFWPLSNAGLITDISDPTEQEVQLYGRYRSPCSKILKSPTRLV